MSKTQDKVIVIIPAFNEGAVIKSVVRRIVQELAKTSYRYEVVVVDDGSSDNTISEAKAGGAYVIRHILNSGAGAATATGLSYASQNDFDVAATMDGDGQHDPKDVVRGFTKIQEQKADLLIGSRLIDSEGMSKVKVLGNRGLSFITYLIFGINSTDSQSGLRIFSKNALSSLRWRTTGYEFCSEMLWRAEQQGLTIREYPIKAIYTKYSIEKGQNNWNAFNIIKTLLKRRISELLHE